MRTKEEIAATIIENARWMRDKNDNDAMAIARAVASETERLEQQIEELKKQVESRPIMLLPGKDFQGGVER